MRVAFLALLLAAPLAQGCAAGCAPAKASPTEAVAAAELAHAGASVVPTHVDSFTVACATTATEITAPSGAQYWYECLNPATTAVAVGDNDLAAPASASSPTFCKTNCERSYWEGPFRSEFCRVDSGTVTIYCRAQVASAP